MSRSVLVSIMLGLAAVFAATAHADGLPVEDLGTREVKNVDRPVRLFRLQ